MTGLGLSIVIPAFQEERRLGPMLDRVVEFSAGFAAARPDGDGDVGVEVVVVDDGSTDGTSEIAEGYGSRLGRLRVVRSPTNRGKGHTVRVGMLAASGRWRAFLDADGSVDPSELHKLLAVGSPVVIGSVAVPGAVLDPPQPRHRVLLGQSGNLVIRALVLPGIHDSQRGCKLFRADVAEAVFSACTVDGWGFDVEALALARRLGHEPIEVGVRWSHRPGGTIGPADYLRTLRDVLAIRRSSGRVPSTGRRR